MNRLMTMPGTLLLIIKKNKIKLNRAIHTTPSFCSCILYIVVPAQPHLHRNKCVENDEGKLQQQTTNRMMCTFIIIPQNLPSLRCTDNGCAILSERASNW